MKRQRRRLNWVRVTRDPAVAAAYQESAQASAAWTLALQNALGGGGTLSASLNLSGARRAESALRFWIDADQTLLGLWVPAIDQALAQLPAS